MIGMIPSASKTYEVYGDFSTVPLVEGKLYYDSDNRLYYYSSTLTRSNPSSGYFPIWDGTNKIESKYSNKKYFDKDVLIPDIGDMSKTINNDIARSIRYRQRLSENNKKLDPQINDEDNMFTQTVKSVINKLSITKVDLLDMSSDIISDRLIENYYSSLTKVTMMRLEKFHLWIDKIFHMHYDVTVFSGHRELLKYSWPSGKFDTGMVNYETLIRPLDDPFKKIIKVLMVKENISKSTLKSDDVDDYTINNMMTTLHSDKSLSAQLFARFMRMANLSFTLEVFNKNGELVFTYKE